MSVAEKMVSFRGRECLGIGARLPVSMRQLLLATRVTGEGRTAKLSAPIEVQ